MQFSTVLIICTTVLISCTQENDFQTDGSELGEVSSDYRMGEQALGRGRDALHDQGTEETTEDPHPGPSPQFITGAAAEALVQAHGLVPARLAEAPGQLCETNSGPHNHQARPADIVLPAPEPYVPSLWSDEDSLDPRPEFLETLLTKTPPYAPQERATAVRAELSEIGQLLESYRADGCADDTLRNVPRCANHPYRQALTRRNNTIPPEIVSLDVVP